MSGRPMGVQGECIDVRMNATMRPAVSGDVDVQNLILTAQLIRELGHSRCQAPSNTKIRHMAKDKG